MGSKGSASDAGIAAAQSSAYAAGLAYNLGEQQFQWSQQVWNAEQPLVNQSEQAAIDVSEASAAAQQQMAAEAAQQWGMYETTYAPLEQQFVQQAETWASPENIALQRGQAMGAVAEQGQAALSSAAETLRGYGVNPSAPRYASLYLGASPLLGASEAAAGTTAGQNLRLQQLGLESGAINTGRGMVNATGQLTTAGTGAGQTSAGAAGQAAGTAQQNLAGTTVGAGATSNLFNSGTNAMNSYVNAVNGYNQTQAEYAQAQASELGGFGSAIGSMVGLGTMGHWSDERDKTDVKRVGTHQSGIPLYGYRYKGDPKTYPKVVGPMAQDVARVAPHRVGAIPGSNRLMLAFQDGGDVPTSPDAQYTPPMGGGYSGTPGQAIPPQMPPDGTPGGVVPAYASPSNGQREDDVPAMLTQGEFVMPNDVVAHLGQQYFYKLIDKARNEQQQMASRGDIGGEPTGAMPQAPTFVSRPAAMIPGGRPAGAIPQMPQQAAA